MGGQVSSLRQTLVEIDQTGEGQWMVVDLVALVEENKEHFTEESADAAIAMLTATMEGDEETQVLMDDILETEEFEKLCEVSGADFAEVCAEIRQKMEERVVVWEEEPEVEEEVEVEEQAEEAEPEAEGEAEAEAEEPVAEAEPEAEAEAEAEVEAEEAAEEPVAEEEAAVEEEAEAEAEVEEEAEAEAEVEAEEEAEPEVAEQARDLEPEAEAEAEEPVEPSPARDDGKGSRWTDEELQEAFELFDMDRTGAIGALEMQCLLEGFGVQGVALDEKSYDVAFFKAKVEAHTAAPGSVEEIRAAFKTFDLSKTGELTVPDVFEAVSLIDARVTEAEVAEVVRYCAMGEGLSDVVTLEGFAKVSVDVDAYAKRTKQKYGVVEY